MSQRRNVGYEKQILVQREQKKKKSGNFVNKVGMNPANNISFVSNTASAGDVQATLPRRKHIQQEIQRMEKQRDYDMREKRRIGCVANKVREPDYRINVRRVNFRWQRGIKIGELALCVAWRKDV